MIISLDQIASQARWVTGRLVGDHSTVETAQIPYQGSDADPRGFVRFSNLKLENGSTNNVLRTHPKWVNRGTIRGYFPWITLPANAVFDSRVGFVHGATHTDGVHFQVWVHYMEDGRERWYRIGSLTKNYSGQLGEMRCDLSRFSGQQVALELRCDAVNRATQAWAAWVYPSIRSDERVGDLPVTVSLDRFTCHNADEDSWYSDGDEPYLFVFVIVLDGYGIPFTSTSLEQARQQLGQARVRVFSAPRTHGNLNRTRVTAGQNFPIPSDTGRFDFWLKPVQPLPNILSLSQAKTITQVGVAVIAMEEDCTPTSTVNSARGKMVSLLQTKLNAMLQQKLGDALRGTTPKITQNEVNSIVNSVKNEVVGTIKQQTLNSFNVFAMADPDDFVGVNYDLWSYNQLENAGWQGIPINWQFRAKGVHYGINGTIRIG